MTHYVVPHSTISPNSDFNFLYHFLFTSSPMFLKKKFILNYKNCEIAAAFCILTGPFKVSTSAFETTASKTSEFNNIMCHYVVDQVGC